METLQENKAGLLCLCMLIGDESGRDFTNIKIITDTDLILISITILINTPIDILHNYNYNIFFQNNRLIVSPSFPLI